MERIYLDYNLFAYLCDGKNPDLHAKVKGLSDGHMFPYSPAHMEEIATALMHSSSATEVIDRLEAAFRKLASIAQISGNAALLPAEFGPIVLKEEHPRECFRRVIRHYDWNPIVEKNEEQMLTIFKENDPNGELANQISNLPDDFLRDSNHGENLKLKLYFDTLLPFLCKNRGVKSITWPEISAHFPILERAIEIAMNFLEQVRYRPEKVSKSRSRMHDVTHCIYACGCQLFITNDLRLYDKVKAVYRYFGVPTRVQTLEEFMANDMNKAPSTTASGQS